jgi:hypothetical protein
MDAHRRFIRALRMLVRVYRIPGSKRMGSRAQGEDRSITSSQCPTRARCRRKDPTQANDEGLMRAHAVEIDTKQVDRSCAAHGLSYRWRCSCGRIGPWWLTKVTAKPERSARNGGARHVAAMERAR